MSEMNWHICNFSGDLMDLKKKDRTEENALRVLNKSPRVSTWDMTEKWINRTELWIFLKDWEKRGLIKSVDEPYPWHKYVLTKTGKEVMVN